MNCLRVVVVLVVWFVGVESHAVVLEDSGKCFDLKLLGGIVNVDACESTTLGVVEVNCQNRSRVRQFRKKAALNKCTKDSAGVRINLSGQSHDLHVKQVVRFGMERWFLSKVSSPEKLSKKRRKMVEETLEANSTDPVVYILEDETVGEQLQWSLQADFSYAYNANTPPVSPDPDSLQERNALFANGRGDSGLMLDAFSAVLQKEVLHGEAVVELAEGPLQDVANLNLDGTLSTGPLIRRVFWEAQVGTEQQVKIGRMRSLMSSYSLAGQERSLYVLPILEVLAKPVFQQGLQYNGGGYQLALHNGWSVEEDSERNSALAAAFDWSLSRDFHVRPSFYLGQEDAGYGMGMRKIFQVQMDLEWSKSLRVKSLFLLGSSDDEQVSATSEALEWNSWLLDLTYKLGGANSVTFRWEDYQQTEGLWGLDLQAASQATLGWKSFWRPELASFLEVKWGLANDLFYRTNSVELSNTQIVILAGASFQL